MKKTRDFERELKMQERALKESNEYRSFFEGRGDLNRDTSLLGPVKGLENTGKWTPEQDKILIDGIKHGVSTKVLAMMVKHSEPCTWARARRTLKVWYSTKNPRRAMTPEEKEQWRQHLAVIRGAKYAALKALTKSAPSKKVNK
jgi:hypothetical protein